MTHPWIEQVCEGIKNAVQNGIENLSGTSIAVNAHPEDGYRFPARTADELKATSHLVPATVKIDDLPPDDDQTHVDLAKAPPTTPKGWIL